MLIIILSKCPVSLSCFAVEEQCIIIYIFTIMDLCCGDAALLVGIKDTQNTRVFDTAWPRLSKPKSELQVDEFSSALCPIS